MIFLYSQLIKSRYQMIKIIIVAALLLLASSLEANTLAEEYDLIDFGMNKPHLLFHLGDRHPVSVNYGFGYWMNGPRAQKKRYFTPLRLWYQNTNNGLYVNMINHDGNKHIHEKIEDRTYGVESNIRYQFLENNWQQHISVQKNNLGDKKYQNHSSYWFTYMTVENNDPALVDHKQYSTPIYLTVKSQTNNEMVVSVQRATGRKQNIYIKSQTPMKVFGFSMNISQSYDIRYLANEVQHLIEVQRYKNTTRKNDSKAVDWENSQIELIKKNQWQQKKYVILIMYGEYSQHNSIHVSNSSETFDSQYFQTRSQQLNKTYFPVLQHPEYSQFLRHVVYNLYGGSAFYYGVLYTQNSLLAHQLDYSFTFTPSRLIFPRGFLWDDGFHLSVALHYNPRITLHVIHNWLRKIDLFGWIGRQQIRGYEMSSLMPEIKFVYQDIFEMNPPTLLLPIISLLQKSKAGQLSQEDTNYLNELLQQNFWKLQKWFRYFLKTQSHNNLMENEAVNRSIKYRWRCKDDCERGNFMGSGLDDYPRTQKQHQISKQHVDLMSWIYFFAEGLEEIATYLDEEKPMKYYRQRKEEMRKKIYSECLDQKDLLFKDQSVAGKSKFIDEHVTRIGYMNLFPFFIGLLKNQNAKPEQQQRNKAILHKLVQIIGDEDQLLSKDGIRSLSITDPSYGTDDNYWRGAVWMPINYMVLRACKKFYWEDESVRQLYEKVRERLINGVYNNWQESGYLYENYHEGKGNRGFPFYGWTSLIANIITEQY